MPRCYFNIYNDDVTLDDEGAELASPQAARAYTIEQARVLTADRVLKGHLTSHHRLEIMDDNQQVIDVVTFGEAIELRD